LHAFVIGLLLCCVQDVLYSSDGSQVLSCSSDGTVRIWDAKTCEQLHGFRCENTAAAATIQHQMDLTLLLLVPCAMTVCTAVL
jgi:WD40 repeat protein